MVRCCRWLAGSSSVGPTGMPHVLREGAETTIAKGEPIWGFRLAAVWNAPTPSDYSCDENNYKCNSNKKQNAVIF
eukprot:2412733-Amphidinium_carterae.1